MTPIFRHADGSGNITSLIDTNGYVLARYLYDPFGRVIGKWGSLADANVFQFSSMQRHPGSGLSLYLCRAYDPTFQAWLNRDPIGERGGINLYQFVGNNPVDLVDPHGLDPFDVLALNEAARRMGALHGRDWQTYEEAARDLGIGDAGLTKGGTEAIESIARTAGTSADIYVNGMQQFAMAGIVAKGTQTAAQGIADAAEEGLLSKLLSKCKFWNKQPQPRLGTLKSIGVDAWESSGGLQYVGFDKNGLNRVEHVLEHLSPDAEKQVHTLFNVQRNELLGLLDEAWSMRGALLPNDPGAYVIPMGRVIGTTGETSVKIVVRPGTSQVITAYPFK